MSAGAPTAGALGLYAITSGHDARTVALAAAVARGGADVVQVRCKDVSTRALTDLARRVSTAVAQADPRCRVVVDDRADVAYALRREGRHVHGVHLGQDDLDPRAARAMLGADSLIGLTTGTLALVEASAAVADVVDYLGAGPFRPTPTKDSGRAPLGLAGYPPLVAATPLPVVAIGDITPDDVVPLLGTGVAGVALVRALTEARDPEGVARGIRRRLEGCSRAQG